MLQPRPIISVSSLGLLFVGILAAQDPPPQQPAAPPAPAVLQNGGKPISVPYACTAEDIRSAGLSCSEDQPCAIFLEAAAATEHAGQIFVLGNIHTEAVTLYSILLASADDGKTWSEAYARIPAAGLDRIQFLNAQDGWISGEELSPLPQDPFFLITGDGGKTWRQRPLFAEESDNRFGLVLQVASDGKTNLAAIVDRGQGSDTRYVLFLSDDAGATWQIKQESSKAIQLPRTLSPAPPPSLKVRVEAATKSFVVERQGGAIARFAIQLSPCKPE